MNPTVITSLEIVGSFLLTTVLITAVYAILQYYTMPELFDIPQNRFLIPLLAGLAMLGFLMINLIWSDIWNPDITLGFDVLAAVFVINLPLVLITIWEWRLLFRQA